MTKKFSKMANLTQNTPISNEMRVQGLIFSYLSLSCENNGNLKVIDSSVMSEQTILRNSPKTQAVCGQSIENNQKSLVNHPHYSY